MTTKKEVALVTGAAQGIGYACAEVLAADGYRVVVADIASDGAVEAARKIGNGAVGLACDMADTEEVLRLFDQVEADVGPVRVLVNNAGIAMPGDFMTYALDDFRKVIDVNLIGCFAASQRAAKTMVAQKIEGAIINMSSVNAVLSIPAIPAYCASKGAVNQLTRAMSLSLAPHNIRVNAVGPGSIDTAMLGSLNSDPAAMAKVLSRTPLKRLGSAHEIASIVSFLASDKASYITGETIYADGGRLGLNYVC